tara:strand:+ start:16763 stop:17833 length:1071 start_codon:yes stop_codon:yes gene_type:complete
MRLCLELTALLNPVQGGVGRYTRKLTEGILRLGGDDLSVDAVYRASRRKRKAKRFADPRVRSRWVQEPIWPLFTNYDVVHGTDARVPKLASAARIATLHDVFSLVTERFAREKFRNRMAGRYADLAQVCDHVIAVSQATKRDFLEHLDFPEDKIEVIYEGVDAQYRPHTPDETAGILEEHGIDRPFVFFLGELSVRKNVANLVRAFAASNLRSDHLLVLAGAPTYGFDEIQQAIRECDVESKVKLLGYANDAELPALHAAASVFGFPTHYEGFGLPALEALASETPLVAGIHGAVPEIVGQHAVQVDPDDPVAIARALETARDMDPAARAAARAHAQTFTWDRCAEQTLEVYRRFG